MAVAWVDTTSDATSVLVTVGGELDQTSCPTLRDALTQACWSGLTVTVEMSAVTFLDSSVLGVLTATARHLRGTDQRLAILHPSERVLAVLSICGLMTSFDITPSPPTLVPLQPSPAAEPPLVIDLGSGATRRGARLT